MIIDVSVRLHQGLPHWPSQPRLTREVKSSTDAGDRSTVSVLHLGAHTGTHMDAPIHFVAGGAGIESIPLDACIGECFVADLTSVSGAIRAEDLATVPAATERLLAKTRNSGWQSDAEFREDFCAYDASAAQWCADNGIKLVGIDYLSIEPFGSAGNPTHKILLGAGLVVLEGIDLAGVEPGAWELIALPVLIDGGDGAPARVVLRRI